MAIIDSYLGYVIEMEASDFLMPSGGRPMMRVQGQLTTMRRNIQLNPSDVEYHVREVLDDEQLAQLPIVKSLGFMYEPNIEGTVRRFRGRVYYQRNGLNITMRVLPPAPPTLQSLGLPPSVGELAELRHGLVLVTSPPGHGRSFTMAALIGRLLELRRGHVVSIEDPVEMVQASHAARISQREVGEHVESFAAGVLAARREDADVLLLSDVPDADTAWLAMRAADAGMLVVAALAAQNGEACLHRWIGLFAPDQQAAMRKLTAATLVARVAQRLEAGRAGQRRKAVVEVVRHTPASGARALAADAHESVIQMV